MKESSDQYSDTIEQLQAKVQALTDENRLLKQRMDAITLPQTVQ